MTEMESASNGARRTSNGLWVWQSGGYYGFGETPDAAFRNADRYIGLPREHDALIEYVQAGFSERSSRVHTCTSDCHEGVYVRRGGVYLVDDHAGVMIDSAGNFLAKTRGEPRALAAMLRLIADDIDTGPSRLAREWTGEWPGSEGRECDGCGADIYHGEPHYGDCAPQPEGRES